MNVQMLNSTVSTLEEKLMKTFWPEIVPFRVLLSWKVIFVVFIVSKSTHISIITCLVSFVIVIFFVFSMSKFSDMVKNCKNLPKAVENCPMF